MEESFKKELFDSHQECTKCPSQHTLITFVNELMGLLFPAYAASPVQDRASLDAKAGQIESALHDILYNNLIDASPEDIIEKFIAQLPGIYHKLQKDIHAMYEGDPAARSEDEVVRAYPGFFAIATYRIAHVLFRLGVRNIPRMMTEYAHSKTGIDIHPGAVIGQHFCIDHGTGVVIGETCRIGEHVKIYQGVTLGALSVNKQDATVKRHPTIEDRVVLYAGATILGGDTVIGHDSVIGGNVWLTKSVPAGSKVYYQARMTHSNEGTVDEIIYK